MSAYLFVIVIVIVLSFLKKLTLWPEKVDSGVTGESLLQPSKIAHFIEVLGVFGRKKSLFLVPILPDFGSFSCFLSLATYFVMGDYGLLAIGFSFRLNRDG